MGDPTILAINHIVQTPELMGGEPHIAGRGVTVREIVRAHVVLGAGIPDLVRTMCLSRAEVYAALAYYYDHQSEFDGSQSEEDSPLPFLDREMTASEVAAVYHVTPQAVREAATKGWIQARKSGAAWLMRRRDAEARWGKKK